MLVDVREELDSGEFRGETLAIHETLNHAHDTSFKVFDANGRQYLLYTCGRL